LMDTPLQLSNILISNKSTQSHFYIQKNRTSLGEVSLRWQAALAGGVGRRCWQATFR
jgi:hypothetical protein